MNLYKVNLHVEIDKDVMHYFSIYDNETFIEEDNPLKYNLLKSHLLVEEGNFLNSHLLKSNLLTTDKEMIHNEVNPLIAIDKDRKYH